ncbi:hypothetical protein PG990_009487 [Apiospora arundinis]
MDLQGAAPMPLPNPSPSVAASSHHYLDSDSSDWASPSTSSGATAQFTPDKDPNSSSEDDEKDGETLWADDEEDGRHHVESGFVASYELQALDHRAGKKPARPHDDEGKGYAPNPATRRRLSESTAASFQLYTPDEEQAVVRKFDRKLVLFLSLCYMLSFLDRSNIGNARIAGMENDLQSRPPRSGLYEWSLTSFYISYIAFEWMSLLWRVIPAHVYVSLIVLSWGVIASLQAVATSYPMLIFLRTLLALFIAAAPLATTFSSSLAWLILKLGESGPIAPWRLLFLVEGFPSVVIAVIAWSVIPDSPQTARYLTARERKVAHLRLRHEKDQLRTTSKHASESRLKVILSVLLDPKAWLTAVMFFLTNMAYSSLPVFLPMILKEMGHTALESQALSAPPYLIAFVTVLATAHLSDKLGVRSSFVVVHALASAAGYLALALARPLGLSPMLRYLAIYPAAVGFFNVVVLVVAWNVNNQPSESRRGGGFALMQVVGQCGPLVGTRLYPKGDEPFFEPGMWTCAGAMAGVALIALALRLYLARLNGQMDDTAKDSEGNGDGEEAQGLVGSPRIGGVKGKGQFRYML